MRRRRFFVAAAALMLGACGNLPIAAGLAEALGPSLAAFSISGRLALRQGERSDHAGFDWRHTPSTDELVLSSPLGQDLARIVRDAKGARMTRGSGEEIAAGSLDALAEKLFGAPLPFSELAAWVGGEAGWAGQVDGWRIAVTETVPYRQRRLPRRIEVRRDEIELILLVREWGEAT